jgi:hypothetical protein
MEILAGLVQLNKPGLLPAPWFNRPSLGLVTNTPVRVGVLKATDPTEAPPDIIVTPLRTDRLHCTASVIIDLKERTGAVYQALSQVGQIFNIALAETVTIDQRTRHRITLILEPTDPYTGRSLTENAEYSDHLAKFEERIRSLDGCISFSSNFVVDENTRFERQETSVVEYGSIDCNSIRDWLVPRYVDKFKDRFDFSRVIVSSSADGRFIRYIFPKRGVFEATVSHLDKPTALVQISSVFHNLEHNILLSRLSRSMKKPRQGKSIYVAICEPMNPPSAINHPSQYATDIANRIIQKLDDCDPDYQFALENGRVSLGARIDTVAYPYRHGIDPGVREISAQDELRTYFGQYKLEGKKAIFLSYTKALKSTHAGSALQKHVIEHIEKSGAIVFDGYSLPRPLHNDLAADVRARMWLASAAIFFAYDKDQSGNLSENQWIEWGYIYGQGKPWAVIVRDGEESKVKHFMTPDVSFITYRNLDTQLEIDEVSKKVSDVILRWFPITL